MTNARASAFILIIILLTYGLYRIQHGLNPEVAIDSYGVNGSAYGAAYELLGSLEHAVDRNVRPPSSLGSESDGVHTIWWLNAWTVCASDENGEWPVESWMREGGTAVVFLRAHDPRCESIGSLELPRIVEYADEESPVEEGRETDDEKLAEDDSGSLSLADFQAILGAPEPSSEPQWIRGSVVAQARDLSIKQLAYFEEPDPEAPWRATARVEGNPFVIETRVGDGRLVVVADDRFVTNRYLDFNDSALLVVDMANAYGTPVFDEFYHGHRPAGGAIPYLVRSPAWPVFVTIGLVGLLVVWRGSAVPARSVPEADPRAPALEPFVASLSNLYGASRDQQGVLEHYREQIIDRARRRAHLPVGTPRSVVLERASSAQLPAAEIGRELTRPLSARGNEAFEREANRLDRLLDKMTR